MDNPDELKLIFVLKIGYNSNGEGLYEFIFSTNETNIDIEGWMWDMSPACDNAIPPTKEYVDKIVGLKTKSFDLFCLHEAVDREYMHGYHNIHALAYETEMENEDGFDEYEKMYDEDIPLLVFHYGMTLTQVKNILSTKKVILKDNHFIETSLIEFD